MKLKFFYAFVVAACCFPSFLSAQNTATTNQVTVFKEVLATAKWAGFDYEGQLNLAKTGDYKAVNKLLEFSGTVDGDDAIKHAVTCLELIPVAGDVPFAAALNVGKPMLRKVMLERLQLAQARTQNEALKKPIKEWAPFSWDVLNGKPFAPVARPDDQECLSSRPHKAPGEAGYQSPEEQAKIKAQLIKETGGSTTTPSAIKQ